MNGNRFAIAAAAVAVLPLAASAAVPNEGGEYWYKARVEMITIDGEKETRKNVALLVQANMLDDAIFALRQALKSYDCEILSIAKSPVMDILHATH